MNSEWFEAIKRRATAKTLAEGPWACSMGMFPDDDDLRPNAVYFAVEMPRQEMSRDTADFIGHSRTDIPALLELIEKQREALEAITQTTAELRAENEQLEAQVAGFRQAAEKCGA